MFIRRLRDLLPTTPSAPLRNGNFYLWAQPPLLENGGEWTPLAKRTPCLSTRVATCGTVLRIDQSLMSNPESGLAGRPVQ